jgi:hypothetical protein
MLRIVWIGCLGAMYSPGRRRPGLPFPWWLTCQPSAESPGGNGQQPLINKPAPDYIPAVPAPEIDQHPTMASPKPTRTKPQARNSVLKLSLLSLLSATTPIINSGVRASADAHRRDDISFRGPVPEDLQVPHWDFSGSALVSPLSIESVHIYLILF